MATPRDRREAGITAPRESGRRPLAPLPFLLLAVASVVLPLLPYPWIDAFPVAVATVNLMHPVLALALAVAIGRLLPARWAPAHAWAAPLASFCLLAGVEAVQRFAPWGDPSLLDLLGDAAGALLGCAWLLPRDWPWRGVRGGLLALGLALALPAAFEVASAVLSESRRGARFPLLGDFEDDGELRAWRARGGTSIAPCRDHATHGGRALSITFPADGRSALVLNSPPGDWSRYSELVAGLFNPGERTVVVRLRVADWVRWRDPSDRFEVDLEVPPGSSRLCVPLQAVAEGPGTRRLDLSSVQALVFLVDRPGSPVRLYLDDLRVAEAAAGCREPVLLPWPGEASPRPDLGPPPPP